MCYIQRESVKERQLKRPAGFPAQCKKQHRLAYFNISEEDIEQNPEQVVKELSHL